MHSTPRAALLWALFLSSALAFSCGDKDNDGPNPTPPDAATNTNTNTNTNSASSEAGVSAGPRDAGRSFREPDLGGRGNLGGDGGRGFPGGGRGQQECPATRPSNGSTCVAGRGDCTIAGATCECLEQTNTWVCWEPSDCPSTPPAERSACSLVGIECEIAMSGPARNELDCECTAQGWDCGRQVCPASEPAANGQCEGGDGVCTFGGRVCDCRGPSWVCWNASDCPAAVPAAREACPVMRMTCDYAGDECECRGNGWSCESHERGGGRRDGGTPTDAGGSDAGATDGG